VHPVIPAKGSLGASGDLAPLAHMSLVLIGQGEAYYQGERLPGAEALRRAGLDPVELGAKEGLALINGTAVMAAIGALTTWRAERLSRVADIAGALSLEALHGMPQAFDERIHTARPHRHQMDCAAHLRRLIEGSEYLRLPEFLPRTGRLQPPLHPPGARCGARCHLPRPPGDRDGAELRYRQPPHFLRPPHPPPSRGG